MLGIDLVSIKRVTKLKKCFGDKALQKYLSPEEILLVKNDATAAGFYAAKEAVSKALGIGISKQCGFLDIQIHKDGFNAPYFTLSQKLIDAYAITDTALSITHDGGFAIAVVVIEGKSNTTIN